MWHFIYKNKILLIWYKHIFMFNITFMILFKNIFCNNTFKYDINLFLINLVINFN